MNDIVVRDEVMILIEKALHSIKNRHAKVSKVKTPKRYVEQKMGLDYVKFPYMKKLADEHYPGWSWKIIKHEIIEYKEKPVAILIHGRLKWFEDGLWREGDAIAAHRIQYKRQPKMKKVWMTPNGVIVKPGTKTDNSSDQAYPLTEVETFARNSNGKIIMEPGTELVDIGNDIKAGNTDCMKKAMSIYLNIADDVYKALIEDISLNEEERDTLIALAKKAGLERDISLKIENGEINKTNYTACVRRLEKLNAE